MIDSAEELKNRVAEAIEVMKEQYPDLQGQTIALNFSKGESGNFS